MTVVFSYSSISLQTKVKYKFVKLCRLCQRVGHAMPQPTNSSFIHFFLVICCLLWFECSYAITLKALLKFNAKKFTLLFSFSCVCGMACMTLCDLTLHHYFEIQILYVLLSVNENSDMFVLLIRMWTWGAKHSEG